MKFEPLNIEGAFLVSLDRIEDERGYFARAWCTREMHEHGMIGNMVQANMGYSRQAGTIRGLHYQRSPHREAKLVRCVKGEVFDVIVDIRPDSSTRGSWSGTRISEDNAKAIYVPEGCAHGYQATCDNATVLYLVSSEYAPGAEAGIRWDDPSLGIEWPITENVVVSDKDLSWAPQKIV